MGKIKGRGDEHACRINYLFQAGQLVAKNVPELSRYYGQVLTVVTEKTAPKKDFTMKRSMCKRCHAVLKMGENATYRVRKNKNHKGAPNIVISCTLCGEKKCLPTARRGYQLKAERNGKIIQNGASSSHISQPNGTSSAESNITGGKEAAATSSAISDDKTDFGEERSESRMLNSETATGTVSVPITDVTEPNQVDDDDNVISTNDT